MPGGGVRRGVDCLAAAGEFCTGLRGAEMGVCGIESPSLSDIIKRWAPAAFVAQTGTFALRGEEDGIKDIGRAGSDILVQIFAATPRTALALGNCEGIARHLF